MCSLQPDSILTSIPPDACFLLRTQENYRTTWGTYVKQRKDLTFLTNHNPLYLSEITLDQIKLEVLMNGSIHRTPEIFEVGPICIYQAKGLRPEAPMLPNSFLSPILYSYNNPERKTPVFMTSYPTLKFRDSIVRNVTLPKMKKIFDDLIVNLRSKEENFDFRLLYQDIFLQPAIDYTLEVMKQSCYTGKKILAVVDWSMVDILNEGWQTLNPKIQSLQKFLQDKNEGLTDESYLDYVEKHVILDMLMEDYIKEYFIDFGIFPFSGEGIFGREFSAVNTMTVWNYNYNRYLKKMNALEKTTDTFDL
eukprot:TRINITY_DN7469_c1_g1_i3.p1 TRINITY_DN7469_c1_g1~~TRINITY_DN7469_c1_g1_i3.p1  ORF type:complete len:306 (+),score=37.10 TRINITY_DN7469_c1_g1_i3:511-1428(+)